LGTYGSEIVEFNYNNNNVSNPVFRMHGHYTPSVYSVTNEIWGLALNPADND